MYKPKSIYTSIALKAIVTYLKEDKTIDISAGEIPDELNHRKGCFVTLRGSDGNLRGCIGTITPQTECLYEEIIQNSISAATNDSRFEAVTLDELENISLSVSVLSDPFAIDDFSDLDPKTKGVIVKMNNRTMSVLLPNIMGIDTVEDQINKLKKKGGIEDVDDKFLDFYAFTAKEYK